MTFDDMMAELRAEYIATFPQKIAEIEAHTSLMDVELIRNDFHKLKGSGKTYGLPEVTDLAIVCEQICLSSSELVKDMVPLAISLLKEIQLARIKNTKFDLLKSDSFSKIQSYTKN